MRTILIDPFTRTVTEHDTDTSLDKLYELLDCECITVVAIGAKHALILDDEGLLKPKDKQEYFWWHGSASPFAGKALIVGDEEGEDRDATCHVEEVADTVIFISKENINPEDYLGATFINVS